MNDDYTTSDSDAQRSNFGPSGHHEPLAEDLARIEDPTHQQRIGPLAGLVDGHFVTVEYRGMLVNRTDTGDIEVSLGGEPLGGRYHLTAHNFAGLIEWLDAKAALYGEAA